MQQGSFLNAEFLSRREFIKKSFTYKECIHFVSSANNPEICGCGEAKEHHETVEIIEKPKTSWSSNFIQKKTPTNAFGLIKYFSEERPLKQSSQFVRMSDDDKLEDVIILMKDYWNLLNPKAPLLGISVIGGAKSFHLRGIKKENFCKGIIRAARATNAWILTSGLGTGVVSAVSDAIKNAESYYVSGENISQKIRCIGIAPWGYVLNRQNLTQSTGSNLNSVNYPLNREPEQPGQPVSLDINHTHHILFDDGIRNSFTRSKVVNFRSELECLIATSKSKGGCGVPVVRIVINGGFDILVQATQSTLRSIPIVVCEDTGRAADIIAKAIHYREYVKNFKNFTETQANELKQMLAILLNTESTVRSTHTVEAGMEHLVTLMSRERLVTLCNLDSSDTLDKAILYALIKGSTTDPADQILIALKFGRFDVIREELPDVATGELQSMIDVATFHKLMTIALLENRVDFVEYILDQELLDIHAYLNISALCRLYNDIDDHTHLFALLKYYGIRRVDKKKGVAMIGLVSAVNKLAVVQKNEGGIAEDMLDAWKSKPDQKDDAPFVDLPMVHKLLVRMVGSFENPLYFTSREFRTAIFPPQPLQDLFLWSVLNNRHELAMIFLRSAEEPFPLGLIGCNLYEMTIRTVPSYDTEGVRALEGQKNALEETVTHAVELCNAKSEEKTMYILERKFKRWGEHKCMPLAVRAKCREFISSSACQSAIRFEWRAGIDANPILLVIANATELDIFQQIERNLLSRFRRGRAYSEANMPMTKKLELFYRAPRTKFCVHTVFYVAFLMYYTYTLLFGIVSDKITVYEAILMVYMCSFAVETARSFLKSVEGKGTTSELLLKWMFEEKWHLFDFGLIVGSTVSMCLRIGFDTTYKYAKTLYAITFIFYFLRIFQVYSVTRKLGSKIVTIRKMLWELASFLLILFIFMIPYGVASQAMLYPNAVKVNMEMVKNIFYYPYYRLYGELFLEEAEGKREGCDSPTGDGIDCPVYNVMPPILLPIYMLIVVVLLINLLIAIFSNVFSDIEAQALQFWKSTKHFLLVEYRSKTIVPAPFGVIQAVLELAAFLIWSFVKYCTSKAPAVQKVGKDERDGDVFEEEEDEEDEKEEEEDYDVLSTQMQSWAINEVCRQNGFSDVHRLEAIHSIVDKILETMQNNEIPEFGNHSEDVALRKKVSSVRRDVMHQFTGKLEEKLKKNRMGTKLLGEPSWL